MTIEMVRGAQVGGRCVPKRCAMLSIAALVAAFAPATSAFSQAVAPVPTEPLTAAQVERELQTLAAAMTASPPRWPDRTFVGATASGTTFSLHLRSVAPINPDAGSSTLIAQCRSPQLRQFTDFYGVTINLRMDPPTQGAPLRILINREVCERVAGSVALPRPAVTQIAPASPAVSTDATGCAAYLGRVVTPISFDRAIQGLGNFPPRSEFETTEQYNARVSAAPQGAPLIIEKVPEGEAPFRYDADRQELLISPFAFDNTGFQAWEALFDAGLTQSLNVSTSENIDAVVTQRDQTTGTYRAQNAFGANVLVTSITRTIGAIFDRGPNRLGVRETLFPGTISPTDYTVRPVGRLSMTPQQAIVLRPNLRIAFVVTPRAPFVVRGSVPVGRTTVQNPTDVTLNYTLLLGDIQCGLLMDQHGMVLGAYQTN